MTLNELARECHELAVEKGWYEEERNLLEQLFLVVSELVEAGEEIRVGATLTEIGWDREIDGGAPRGVSIELADCLIRLLDFCGAYEIDLDEAYRVKMEYNRTRSYRHGGKLA